MVAPIDTFVYFTTQEACLRLAPVFDSRNELGSGRVEARVLEREVPTGVDLARAAVGAAPLGVVAVSEAQGLEAILAGADDAVAMTEPDPAGVTAFLDRVRVRASVRRERERRTQDLSQAERLATLGTLVAGVGHELNNSLAMIALGFDLLRDALLPELNVIWTARGRILGSGELTPDAARELARALRGDGVAVTQILDDLSASTKAVTQVVRDLRTFTGGNVIEGQSLFQPREVIQQALRLVRRELPPRTVIEEDYDDELPMLYLPRNRLAQVLTNLLVNAGQALREVTRETHRLRVGARRDDQSLAISVSDTGPGIEDEALERIFDPFFTTKREGQGLGLSISRTIIRQLGGDLVASSTHGEGATFVCFLPLPSEADLQKAKHTLRGTWLGGPSEARRSVLIIDDDERVLRATARALNEQFKVLVARDGEEARQLLKSGSHVDAIVMEVVLPELDGVAFHDWLKTFDEGLARHVVVATAAHDRAQYRSFLEERAQVVLHKPFHREDLLAALARVTGG